ncbi:MAG TPA: hypothetical protein EYN66_02985, partial [Myxococcales bacterium]|nr:hypothetical protein [Myxococcales bacterium]
RAVLQLVEEGAIEKDRLLPQALAAHAGAQGKAGSGYDVASCCYGGLMSWVPSSGGIQQHEWPESLHIVAAYSGQSARTSDFLARLDGLRARNAKALDLELSWLNEPVRGLERAIADNRVDDMAQLMGECHARLRVWDSRHNLGIVTAGIAEMLKVAAEMGVAAKISGAGGGDSIYALGSDLKLLETLSEKWAVAGFSCVPISLNNSGVQQKDNASA